MLRDKIKGDYENMKLLQKENSLEKKYEQYKAEYEELFTKIKELHIEKDIVDLRSLISACRHMESSFEKINELTGKPSEENANQFRIENGKSQQLLTTKLEKAYDVIAERCEWCAKYLNEMEEALYPTPWLAEDPYKEKRKVFESPYVYGNRSIHIKTPK